MNAWRRSSPAPGLCSSDEGGGVSRSGKTAGGTEWVPEHYKLHPDDPVYLLIAWHWHRVQTEVPQLSAKARVGAVTELCTALRRIAQRELAVFDQICRQRARRQRRTGRETEYTI